MPERAQPTGAAGDGASPGGARAEAERLTQALAVERARLAEVFRQAPSFLAVLRGPTHVFEFANDAYLELVGRRDIILTGLKKSACRRFDSVPGHSGGQQLGQASRGT